MLQLYFANIDFLFVCLFHVSLFACFSLNTFRCLFLCFASFSRKFKYAFVPFINTFTLFFGLFYRAIFLILGVCECLTIICLAHCWIVSNCVCVWMQLGEEQIYDLERGDNKVGRFFNNVLAKIRNSFACLWKFHYCYTPREWVMYVLFVFFIGNYNSLESNCVFSRR